MSICAELVPSGQLDRRVTIEVKTDLQSSSGAPTPSWATFATVWAGKRDLTGRELFDARKEQAEVTTEFTIRYLAGLKRAMRIVLGDDIYDIQHVAEIGRRAGQKVLATAQVA